MRRMGKKEYIEFSLERCRRIKITFKRYVSSNIFFINLNVKIFLN